MNTITKTALGVLIGFIALFILAFPYYQNYQLQVIVNNQGAVLQQVVNFLNANIQQKNVDTATSTIK